MSKHRSFRDISRSTAWGTSGEGTTFDEINCGSLLRIADALEGMVRPYTALLAETKSFRESRDGWEKRYFAKVRSYAALKANFTRLKQKKKKGGAT